MINLNLWASLVVFFLAWAHPSPRNVPRLRQISAAAAEIASTDATEDEARKLARIVTHESSIRPNARGPAGEVGLFQIMPPSKGGYGAREALRRLRWSEGTCGDLSLYAGCGKCGACPRGLLDELEHAGDPPPVPATAPRAEPAPVG